MKLLTLVLLLFTIFFGIATMILYIGKSDIWQAYAVVSVFSLSISMYFYQKAIVEIDPEN